MPQKLRLCALALCIALCVALIIYHADQTQRGVVCALFGISLLFSDRCGAGGR